MMRERLERVCAALLVLTTASGCTISLPGLIARSEPRYSAAEAPNPKFAARAKCLEHYSDIVTTSVANTRSTRRTVTNVITIAAGAIAAGLAVQGALRSKDDPPSSGQLGATAALAGLAALTPLVQLIASSFESDFSQMNQYQGVLSAYASSPVMPIPADVQTAAGTTEDKIVNELGGEFRELVVCQARVDGRKLARGLWARRLREG